MTPMYYNEWSRGNWKKKLEKNWIFGLVTELQIDFLADSELFQNSGDLNLIELPKGFNLHRIKVFKTHEIKSYD